MKDVLNMIRFDLVAVERVTTPYVIGFLALSLVLALFGVPLGIFCFAATLCMFSPVGMVTDPELRKLYGLLPVSQKGVVRAGFAEIVGSLLLGELVTIPCILISRFSTLYTVLPQKLSGLIHDMFLGDTALPLGQEMSIVLAAFGLLSLLSVYLKMVAEIQGQEHAVRQMLVLSLVLVAVIIGAIAMADRGTLPSGISLLPGSTGGIVLMGVLINAAVIGAGLLCCKITVHKTRNREL